MYIDQGEVLRVRVEAEDFYDDEPGPTKMAEGVQVIREPRRAPYNVIVRLALLILDCLLMYLSVFHGRARSWSGSVVVECAASGG
jgi:hypothetical protein